VFIMPQNSVEWNGLIIQGKSISGFRLIKTATVCVPSFKGYRILFIFGYIVEDFVRRSNYRIW